MSDKKRTQKKWRGVKSLTHDAVDATVELVREGHESTSRTVRRFTDEIPPLREPVRVIDGVRRFATNGVLAAVKGVNRAVEVATDAGLDFAENGAEGNPPPEPIGMRSDVTGAASWYADASIAIVNAAVGDHLERTKNPLDLSMTFRIGETYYDELSSEAFEAPSNRVALFVHGLGATEWSWCLQSLQYHGDAATSFATLLTHDLGFDSIFVRYNTGRHVSENGRRLAEMIDALVSSYPETIDDLTLIGHSMGGLVVRSACHYAEEADMIWVRQVRRLFYLGSPHRGAPLAKVGDAVAGLLSSVDLPATRIIGRIVHNRSAGIHDLRHGALIDEEWTAPHPLPVRERLPAANAKHYFVSASVTEDGEHPVGKLLGDLMVRQPSAEGDLVASSEFSIDTEHYGGVLHHQLQNHPSVYAQIRRACEED